VFHEEIYNPLLEDILNTNIHGEIQKYSLSETIWLLNGTMSGVLKLWVLNLLPDVVISSVWSAPGLWEFANVPRWLQCPGKVENHCFIGWNSSNSDSYHKGRSTHSSGTEDSVGKWQLSGDLSPRLTLKYFSTRPENHKSLYCSSQTQLQR
jgi:hypothetical protein